MSLQLHIRWPGVLFSLKQFKNPKHPNILFGAKLRNQARILNSDEFGLAPRKVIIMPLKTSIYTVL